MLMLYPPITCFWSGRLADLQQAAVSPEEVQQAAESGVRFVAGESDTMPRGDDYRKAFTDEVISHMTDVRAVILAARKITLTGAVFASISTAVLIGRGQRLRLGRSLTAAALSTIGLVLILAVFGWLNFDQLFTLMHEVLFTDGTWMFQPDSLLIVAYPTAFWTAMAATWAAVIAGLCLLSLAAGRLLVIREPQNRLPTTAKTTDG